MNDRNHFSETSIQQFLTLNADLIERGTRGEGQRALQSTVALYACFAARRGTPALAFERIPSPSQEEAIYRPIYVHPEIAALWEQFAGSQEGRSDFPPLDLPAPFGGFLTYSPWVQLPADVRRALPVALENAGRVEDASDCENGDILADWRLVRWGEGGRITHRGEFVMFRDGPDWGGEDNQNIGVLFCRRDIDQTVEPEAITYSVHVPPDEQQPALLEACSDWPRDLARGGNHLKTLTAYLDSIVNDASAWHPLPLSDDSDEENEE